MNSEAGAIRRGSDHGKLTLVNCEADANDFIIFDRGRLQFRQ